MGIQKMFYRNSISPGLWKSLNSPYQFTLAQGSWECVFEESCEGQFGRHVIRHAIFAANWSFLKMALVGLGEKWELLTYHHE